MVEKLFETMDRANPNNLADSFKKVGIGSMLNAQVAHTLYRKVPAASDPNQLATVHTIKLPNDAKAAGLVHATGYGGIVGEFVLELVYGATPQAGEISIAPNGDLVVLAADAVTLLDVTYIPRRMDVVELTLPVATGILVIPSMYKAVMLLEAEVTAGTVTGRKGILVPAGSLPATTKAVLKNDMTQVLFNNATDAPTEARVILGVVPAIDAAALLNGDGLV